MVPHRKPIVCLVMLILFAAPGCNMDEGFDGNIPQRNVFLDEWGCVSADLQVFSSFLPFDLTDLDVSLDVVQGQADLLLGRGDVPLSYFSPGTGPGSQKLRVGPASSEPMQAGTWTVTLASPADVTTECDPDNPTDWHLVMHRTGLPGGIVLLEETCRSAECAVPRCTQASCPPREFTFDMPGDAVSLQVELDSIEGDADLFLVSASGAELSAAMNPGTGYDIAQLGPELVTPLHGQTVTVRLESWDQVTGAYNLRVAYSP
jgi:hypothetical protein